MIENISLITSEQDVMANHGCDPAEIHESTTTIREAIEWMRSNLQNRDFEIVCRYFGLEGQQAQTIREIASEESVQLSRARIGQILQEVYTMLSEQGFSDTDYGDFPEHVLGVDDLSAEQQVLVTAKALKDRDTYCELLKTGLADWPVEGVNYGAELSEYQRELQAKQSDKVVREVAVRLDINQSFENLISILKIIDSFSLGPFFEQCTGLDKAELIESYIRRSGSTI